MLWKPNQRYLRFFCSELRRVGRSYEKFLTPRNPDNSSSPAPVLEPIEIFIPSRVSLVRKDIIQFRHSS